ncbi:MAG: hypothetical protein R3F45_15580 [Gammaproteobacteria bacterium]
MRTFGPPGKGWLLAVAYALIAVALWWRDASDIAWFDFILLGLILVLTLDLRRRLGHISSERIATKSVEIIGEDDNTQIRLTVTDGTPRLEMYRPGIPATTGPPAVCIEVRGDGSYIEISDGGTLVDPVGPGLRIYARNDGDKGISLNFPPPSSEEGIAPDQLFLEVAQQGARLMLRQWDYDGGQGSERVLWRSA